MMTPPLHSSPTLSLSNRNEKRRENSREESVTVFGSAEKVTVSMRAKGERRGFGWEREGREWSGRRSAPLSPAALLPPPVFGPHLSRTRPSLLLSPALSPPSSAPLSISLQLTDQPAATLILAESTFAVIQLYSVFLKLTETPAHGKKKAGRERGGSVERERERERVGLTRVRLSSPPLSPVT